MFTLPHRHKGGTAPPRTGRATTPRRTAQQRGTALTSAGVGYRLGDTTVANCDFLLEASADTAAGLEVTARAPQNITELVERIEEELTAYDGLGAHLVFNRYPNQTAAPRRGRRRRATRPARQRRPR